jgi:hypothetical protein
MSDLIQWFADNGDNLKTLMSILSPFIAIYGTNKYAENRAKNEAAAKQLIVEQDTNAKLILEASKSQEVKITTLEAKVELAERYEILEAIKSLDIKITDGLSTLEGKMTTGLSDLEGKMTTGLSDLEGKMTEGFKKVDERFDDVDSKFDAIDIKFEKVDNKLDKLTNKVNEVVIGLNKHLPKLFKIKPIKHTSN